MTAAKIYANRDLYDIFADVVTKKAHSYKSGDVAEALRIRRKGLNIDAIVGLLALDETEIKDVLKTVKYGEEVAETTDEVPHLYDLR